jgi:hypothetical protein
MGVGALASPASWRKWETSALNVAQPWAGPAAAVVRAAAPAAVSRLWLRGREARFVVARMVKERAAIA